MVFYNNLLTTLILSVAAFFYGDFNTFIVTPQLHTFQYLSILLFSGEQNFCVLYAASCGNTGNSARNGSP